MTNSYTNIFGSTAVRPAQPSYLALAMAVSTTLVWPLESTEGEPYVASAIDVTPSTTGLSLLMPPANQGSDGVASMVTNVGASNFTLRDNVGNQIAVLAPTQSWLVLLTDNSTVNGTWRALQMASTTSSATAGSLAGAGLSANGSLLQQNLLTQFKSINYMLVAGDRAKVTVWQGAVGTFSLDTVANLGTGWLTYVRNRGTDALTISPTGGATIDGAASLVLEPQNSALIVCDSSGFNTIGDVAAPLSITNGGTGAQNATSALINLGGSTVGIAILTAPSVASVVALLGLNNTSLTESTVATNQTLNSGSTQTAYVCTAALQLNLPLTTSLTTNYIFAAYAQGGNVTVHPNVLDKINNAGAGVDYVLSAGQSALFTTDANGNWWPFYTATGGTVTSVALSAPADLVVTGSPVTTTGTLALAWANESANVVHAGPASGGAATPTWRALVVADLPTVDVPHGGTGLTTLTAHLLYVGNGASAPNSVAIGTAGQILTSNGAGSDPTFQTLQKVNAYVRFTVSGGVVTIAGSFNVSSVTRTGVGLYTVNFTSALPSANYVASTQIADNAGIVFAIGTGGHTTTGYSFETLDLSGNLLDATAMDCSFIGG